MILKQAGILYGKAQQLKDGTIQVLKDSVFVNLTSVELEELEALAEVEAEKRAIKKQLAEKRAYLASTDWIGAKYHDEVTVSGTMSKAEFTAKYEDIYTTRAAAREFINQNETENNA